MRYYNIYNVSIYDLLRNQQFSGGEEIENDINYDKLGEVLKFNIDIPNLNTTDFMAQVGITRNLIVQQLQNVNDVVNNVLAVKDIKIQNLRNEYANKQSELENNLKLLDSRVNAYKQEASNYETTANILQADLLQLQSDNQKLTDEYNELLAKYKKANTINAPGTDIQTEFMQLATKLNERFNDYSIKKSNHILINNANSNFRNFLTQHPTYVSYFNNLLSENKLNNPVSIKTMNEIYNSKLDELKTIQKNKK